MNIITIPIKNLKRKILRTILLVMVFTIGILSMVALINVSRIVGTGLEKQMNQYGANILVFPKSDELKVSYGGFDLGTLAYNVKYPTGSTVVENIKNIELNENISCVAPKLLSVVKLENQAVGIVGVDWQEESLIKGFWNINGKLPEYFNQILVGSKIAENFKLVTGNNITLEDNIYEITGVLSETGSDDDNVIFIGLEHLQKLTGKEDLINYVEVSALCSACPIDDIVDQISGRLPGIEISAVQQLVKQRMSAIDFVGNLAFAVSMVILLTACFMIALFMLASVNERKKEIGIFRSLGYSRKSVFGIFCFEAFIIGLLAGIFGYFSGYVLSLVLINILNIAGQGSMHIEILQLIITVTGVTLVSVIASIAPASKAARIDPSDALVML